MGGLSLSLSLFSLSLSTQQALKTFDIWVTSRPRHPIGVVEDSPSRLTALRVLKILG